MPVEETPKPRGRLLRALSWAVLLVAGISLMSWTALNMAGLRVTSEASYRANLSNGSEPVPTLNSDTKTALPGMTITGWFWEGPVFFSAGDTFAEEMSRGEIKDDRLAYYIAFDEAGFNSFLSHWVFPDESLSEYHDGDMQNLHIDLIPGGLVAHFELMIGSEWKRAGLIFELDESGTQLSFRGISIDGSVVSTLPGSPLDSELGRDTESHINQRLREIMFIDEQTGKHLTVKQIYFGDDRAEMLAGE